MLNLSGNAKDRILDKSDQNKEAVRNCDCIGSVQPAENPLQSKPCLSQKLLIASI
jgi:hypothetical protein